ncbi:hypothetical protein CDEF62S_04822 [Castellaniella defragrans]
MTVNLLSKSQEALARKFGGMTLRESNPFSETDWMMTECEPIR